MKIVIVGCGKVGDTIAEALTRENHEVTIIDSDDNVSKEIEAKYDILTYTGNGATAEVLKAAGTGEADLLIAVTISDEINILSCLIAKKLGVKSTIARVRNPEYISELQMIKEEIGLSMAINPELEAAREISQLLKFPAAIDVDTFAKGRVEIFKLSVKENSKLDGLALRDFQAKADIKALVCAVERNGETSIPRGDFVLNAGDKISVVTSKESAFKFFKFADCMSERINNCIICGGGKIGYYLANELVNSGISVKMTDRNKARCEELKDKLENVDVIYCQGDEHAILMDEGIETVDAFAALTDFDEENVLLSVFAAQKAPNCKRITKVNHHALATLVKSMEIGSIITPKLITAEQILKYVRCMQNSTGTNVETLYNLSNDVEALEFKISATETDKYIHTIIKDLDINKGFTIACIYRNGEVIIPGGFDTIERGDNIIVVTSIHGVLDIKDIFKG